MRKLSWQGQEMTRSEDGSTVWIDSPNPVGGDVVSMGTLGMVEARNGDTVTHYEVPVTTWGDYCGDSCQRSNYRSLLRDYPETFIEVKGGYFSQYLAIRVEDVTDDLEEIFTGLVEQNPLYGEDDHTQLEWDEANKQFTQWARDDILSSLRRDHGIDTDDLNLEDLEIRFWQFVSEQGRYPYLEDAVTIVYPNMGDFVTMFAETYVRKS